ncbi:MAG TPA: transglutaminase-like domain-containing protein [Dehalococcoidia bacterium]|nr:transglutaminase-like domain-containing protein [Dehalococcoidia bacterium]
MVAERTLLDFYTRTAAMTEPGGHAAAFAALPRDLAGLCRVGQGLYIHEHIAARYGVVLADDRRVEVHLRRTSARLDCLVARDDRPLMEARPPAERLTANCRHYSVLLAATLRAQGVPTRARCGFGSYFEPGRFVDHWVCEVWDAEPGRWRLVDAQLDGLQRDLFGTDFDVLDVPRDRFVIAGDGWARCRAGEADPERFGILDMAGLWFIAGNLVRDVAALNNIELLPWDVWGAMPRPGEPISDEQLTLFDHLAALTHDPDTAFAELRAMYESDARLRVPPVVFNAVLNRPEAW